MLKNRHAHFWNAVDSAENCLANIEDHADGVEETGIVEGNGNGIAGIAHLQAVAATH